MSKRDERVEQACEVMHDAYEAAAVTTGWETQERSHKPWADVPEANKETMRAAVCALLASPLLTRLLADAWSEGYGAHGYNRDFGHTNSNPYRTTHQLNSTERETR